MLLFVEKDVSTRLWCSGFDLKRGHFVSRAKLFWHQIVSVLRSILSFCLSTFSDTVLHVVVSFIHAPFYVVFNKNANIFVTKSNNNNLLLSVKQFLDWMTKNKVINYIWLVFFLEKPFQLKIKLATKNVAFTFLVLISITSLFIRNWAIQVSLEFL